MRSSPAHPAVRHSSWLPEAGSRGYSVLVALACVAGVRLFLTVYLVGAALLFPQPEIREQYAYAGVELLDTGWQGLLLGVWQREDALWYQKIVTFGYFAGDLTTQFFPLYPMLMRAAWLGTGIHPIAAGILVSEISLLAALFLLHRLLLPNYGPDVANRTLVYISLFPSAFFLHAPFSESLTLMLVVLGFVLVSRDRWAEAAVAGYMAGLVRSQGVLLGLGLAVRLLVGERPILPWRPSSYCGGRVLRATALLAGPVLGMATFAFLVDTPWTRPGFSAAVGPMSSQSMAFPWTVLLYAARRILAGVVFPIDIFDFVLAVGFLLVAAVGISRLEAGYWVNAMLSVLAPLSRHTPLFPLGSFSRYALFLFPCFVMLAFWGRRKWVHLAVIFLWLWWLAAWSFKFYTGYFVG